MYYANLIFSGDRASVVRRDDNLHMEGRFESRQEQTWHAGERASVVRRDDNLHPEGEFQKRPDQTWAPGKANLFNKRSI